MKRIQIGILIVLGLAAAQLLWASADETYGELDLFDLILSIIENPDPIPQCHYIPLDADPEAPDTTRSGHRDDGRPMFEFDRRTEEPILTWAFDAGGDHDIAFNEWGNRSWHRRIEFITASPRDEVDPRVYVDDNNSVYLTWWEDDPDSRIMAVKRNRSGWGAPMHVATGRRPSVAVWNRKVVLAYERDRTDGPGQEVVFAYHTLGAFGTYVPHEVVAVTSRNEPLDPIIHVRDGLMWIDWKSSDDTIAASVYGDGGWSVEMVQPWTDPSWVGELTARDQIESELTDD
ncbi:MAG: hypothetical protein GTN89_02610 [Acidobacteria bacterium]|nr:hypothetical protein [Acidobacteriota bacterium]NIM62306.1 hypothetical protein [Acidobacteriota bacterium]NIO58247.1 hypothetical protein [Acidobacteriota bacterium]NIQ29276.1 hypothetical protein [Acidobacteriota bacterium]NIQ83875.1 hypothetical protein [Acidobacteriota bacterium]